MSRAPPIPSALLWALPRLLGRRQLAMRDKRRAPHNESSLSAVPTRQKKNPEPVSLTTLAVPYIAPPHRRHNATPVQFFFGAAFGGFCGGQRKCRARPATTTAVRTRRPLCVSSLFFSHVRQWTCCVPTSMQMTLLVAIAQPSDCFFFPWLNWGQCGLQQ